MKTGNGISRNSPESRITSANLVQSECALDSVRDISQEHCLIEPERRSSR